MEARESKIDEAIPSNLDVYRSSIHDPRSSAPNPQFSPSAIVLWAGVQLFAILVAAGEMPLWAHHPFPRTSLAMREMNAVQLFATAMLFPLLAATGWTIIVTMGLTLTFTELAGLLAAEPQRVVIAACLYVWFWQIGIFGWRRQIRPNMQVFFVCVAVLLSVGGTVLTYIHTEMIVSISMPTKALGSMPPSSAAPHFLPGYAWISASLPIISYIAWSIISNRGIVFRPPSTRLH